MFIGMRTGRHSDINLNISKRKQKQSHIYNKWPLKKLVFLLKRIVDLIVERQAFFKLSSQTHTKYSCHIIRMVGVNVIMNWSHNQNPQTHKSLKIMYTQKKSLTLLDPKLNFFFSLSLGLHSEIIKQRTNNTHWTRLSLSSRVMESSDRTLSCSKE